METLHLIDTNIIIYHLADEIPPASIELIEDIFRRSFNISVITSIEVLGWHKISESYKRKIEEFLTYAKVYYLDQTIEKKSIEIKQEAKINTPDAIIAATAILNKQIVVTRNTKDFSRINGLEVLNPF